MGDKFLFLVHRIYKDGSPKKGGADYISRYLEDNGFGAVVIEHPLYGSGDTKVFSSERLVARMHLIGSSVIRWPQELFFNILFVLTHKSLKDMKLILAVDPLNFLSALFLSKCLKVKVHFHSIDYSESRFGKPLLDKIYNTLYAFSVRHADIVTYVSPLMGEKISKLVPNGETLFYLPNSPEYNKIPKLPIEQKKENSLVYTKSFISDTEIDLLVVLVESISSQVGKVSLNLIGNVSEKAAKAIQKSPVKSQFILHGLISYEKNIEIMSSCLIGVGWYENKISFEKYADSLKLREYAAAGLPSVCNDKISTAFEMQKYGAGYVANGVVAMSKKTVNLLKNSDEYRNARDAALEWAREKDKKKLLYELYSKVFEK